VNTTSSTPRKLSDIDRNTVVVACHQSACDSYLTGHEALAFDPSGIGHQHNGPWEQAPGNVTCYWDEELGRWHASGHLSDIDGPLLADQVAAFNAAWFAAYEAAQRLNDAAVEVEPTC
jgi:hypothetical protein